MALTVTGFASSALAYKIVHESNASDTANLDVTGTSGTILAINVDQQTSAIAYLKMKLTSGTYIATTTEPDVMFEIPASGKLKINFPVPLAFTQLTFWVTDAAATSDTGDPGTVLITILCT